MSQLITHYSPTDYVLLNSQRAHDRRGNSFSNSAPSTSSATRKRVGSAGAVLPHREGSLEQRGGCGSVSRVDHQKMNMEMIREVEARNKMDREARTLEHMSAQIAENHLRAQHSGFRVSNHREGSEREEAVAISPRKNVRAAASARSNPQKSHDMPEYLVRRIQEQQQQKALEAQAAAVAECERNFPKGQEPLNPDVTEQTKLFLETRVAEIEQQLRDVSFRSSCSVLGQRKRASLEQQLRDAESALARFRFPVVFVRASKPRPVINGRK